MNYLDIFNYFLGCFFFQFPKLVLKHMSLMRHFVLTGVQFFFFSGWKRCRYFNEAMLQKPPCSH